MADPTVTATLRADAALRLAAACPRLAAALGIDPPTPPAPEAMKDPHLREARTMESLADFAERAAAAATRTPAAATASASDLAAFANAVAAGEVPAIVPAASAKPAADLAPAERRARSAKGR